MKEAPDETMSMLERRADKRAVRKAFDRAAERYDSAAEVQREACARLAAFAAPFVAEGLPAAGIALDAGCGTGHGLAAVAALCPAAHRIGLDLAPAMLARALCRGSKDGADGVSAICGDLEHLPLANDCAALLWSSLALQWCAPGAALNEIGRVLRPGGLAVVATLGPATLCELEAAFAAIDSADHTIAFHSAESWIAYARAAGLLAAGLANPVLHARAPDLRSLLRDIKTIGASTVGGRRRRMLLGREAWRRLECLYERHRGGDGLLFASYDLILLALRKPQGRV
jgi:malonyl-CoA O-methyltransferase